ncbi:NepR family anti-sigma factor [Methylobacterium sp. A54F]
MTDDGKAGNLGNEVQGLAARESGRGSGAGRKGGGARGLNEQTQRRLGLHLRTMYDAVVQQPVPDRFRDLIARLDAEPKG